MLVSARSCNIFFFLNQRLYKRWHPLVVFLLLLCSLTVSHYYTRTFVSFFDNYTHSFLEKFITSELSQFKKFDLRRIWLKKTSKLGWSLGGFRLDLGVNARFSLEFSEISLRKFHLIPIPLQNSSKSFLSYG